MAASCASVASSTYASRSSASPPRRIVSPTTLKQPSSSVAPAPTADSRYRGHRVSGMSFGVGGPFGMENSESNNTIMTANTELPLTPTSAVHPPTANAGNGGEVADTNVDGDGNPIYRRGATRHDLEAGGLLSHHIDDVGSAGRRDEDGGGGNGGRNSGSISRSPHRTSMPGSPTSSSSSNPRSRRKSALKGLSRIVEQDEQEPICIVLFKWGLILAGSIMLGVVIYVMGEVIWAWIVEDPPDGRHEVGIFSHNGTMEEAGINGTSLLDAASDVFGKNANATTKEGDDGQKEEGVL